MDVHKVARSYRNHRADDSVGREEGIVAFCEPLAKVQQDKAGCVGLQPAHPLRDVETPQTLLALHFADESHRQEVDGLSCTSNALFKISRSETVGLDG
jgi:hypothetical protein